MVKELLEYLAKSLVDVPDGVNVLLLEGERSAILELKVSEDDKGKIIGKDGRVAEALRRVVSAAGLRKGKRVVLDIL
ncbi:MAG TPA: KH domain-containing protein [Candidatus Xenobia bacterium]